MAKQYPMSYEECGLKIIEFKKEIDRYLPEYWYRPCLEGQLAELKRMQFCADCKSPRRYVAWLRCPWCPSAPNTWIHVGPKTE
jgi:hypothetical protein